MLLYEFFSAVVCTVVSSAALGYCYSWPNFNRRRQDVLECTWKSKYSRYRPVVPDLPAKSSSLDSSFQMYLVFSYLKENTHLRKTLCLFREHWYHVLFLLHCYYMTRRICGIKQVIIVAFFCWLPIMFTLFPSLAITNFLHFSYWGIPFAQCATKCPGINCYYKHQSSSLLLLLLFL